MTQIKLSKKIARKVLTTVDAGLGHGVGNPVPGEMCVEAAVCFALGLPHGDNPPCVGEAVRSFKIALNDCNWSSPAARAKGLRRIAIAQLGSNEIDQNEFAKQLALKTVREILPDMLRRVAKVVPGAHKQPLMEHANKCSKVKDLAAASDAASDAGCAARAAARAAGCAAGYAAGCAASAASAAASDKVLSKMAEIGCKWLYLCDE